MKLTLENFRRIKRAEFDISGVTLIVGHNEAGKSTVAQAFAAALSSQPVVLEGLLKKQAGGLVRDGEKSATVTLEDGQHTTSIKYPACTISGDHRVYMDSWRYAFGLAKFAKQDKKTMLSLFTDAVSNQLSQEDIRREIETTAKESGVLLYENVFDGINLLKWDESQFYFTEKARELKSDWRHVTGQNWGAAVADVWQPEGLNKDATEDLLLQAVAHTEASVEAAIANTAVSADERKRLTEDAAKYDDLLKQHQGQKNIIAAAQGALEALREQLDALPKPVVVTTPMQCPSCLAALVVESGKLTHATAQLPEDPIITKDRTALIMAVAEQDRQISLMQGDLNLIAVQGKAARDAKEKLATMPEKTTTGGDVESARMADFNARKALLAFQSYQKAFKIHREIQAFLHIAGELSEPGIRNRRMDKVLKEFNEVHLVKYTPGAFTVEIDAEMQIQVCQRPYALMSTGAQFMADVMLQLAIADFTHAPAVIIDGADVVQYPGRRSALMGIVQSFEGASLITMSMKDPAAAPNLREAGIGMTYVLTAGEARGL